MTTPQITKKKTKTKTKTKRNTEERNADKLNKERREKFTSNINFEFSATPPLKKKEGWEDKVEDERVELKDYDWVDYEFCEIKPPEDFKANFDDLKTCYAFTRCTELMFFVFILNQIIFLI